jgi:hypothetical protein
MTTIFYLSDGSKFATSDSDIILYRTNSVRPSGHDVCDGTNLYAHKTKKHGYQFYELHWTRWQGGRDRYELVSKSEAEKFLAEQSKDDEWGFPDKDDIANCKECGIDLEEETA